MNAFGVMGLFMIISASEFFRVLTFFGIFNLASSIVSWLSVDLPLFILLKDPLLLLKGLGFIFSFEVCLDLELSVVVLIGSFVLETDRWVNCDLHFCCRHFFWFDFWFETLSFLIKYNLNNVTNYIRI